MKAIHFIKMIIGTFNRLNASECNRIFPRLIFMLKSSRFFFHSLGAVATIHVGYKLSDVNSR